MEAFKQAIAEAGLTPPDNIIADGEIHMFSTNGKAADKAGRYCLFDDGLAAGWFKDWRSGIESSWSDSKELTPEDRKQYAKQMEAIKRQRAADETKRKADSITKATAEYKAAGPVTSHPYLTKKGVKACAGVRQSGDTLIIPMRNADGKIQSLQRINDKKRFLSGSTTTGGYFAIAGDDVLCIAEGYSTGVSIREATGHSVAVAFSCSNMMNVAQIMRNRFPDKRIIICGDSDHEKPVNAGLNAAKETAKKISAEMVVPDELPGVTDFNDLHAIKGLDAVREIFEHKSVKEAEYLLIAPPITEDEERAAHLSPRCIVQDYLYADVATIVAAGGSGKTTLVLYEMIHIALGWPLWGNTIQTRGKCLLVTAEDTREICVARLRKIKDDLNLKPYEDAIVRENVRIMDVTGTGIKLVETQRDIALTGLADAIVDTFKDDHLVMVTFDPLVSFGASENAVNDNEQALITAGRKIKNGLNCCVRFIHHTGQAAAREKKLDQYAGRGGSALSDGARMVTVLAPWSKETKKKLPLGLKTSDDVILLARPKLSYAPPQPLIFIHRNGWKFDHYFEAPPVPKEEQQRARKEQLFRFLVSKASAEEYFSKKKIEESYLKDMDMSRDEFRRAAYDLEAENRITQGKDKDGYAYLNPISPDSQT